MNDGLGKATLYDEEPERDDESDGHHDADGDAHVVAVGGEDGPLLRLLGLRVGPGTVDERVGRCRGRERPSRHGRGHGYGSAAAGSAGGVRHRDGAAGVGAAVEGASRWAVRAPGVGRGRHDAGQLAPRRGRTLREERHRGRGHGRAGGLSRAGFFG